MTARFRGRGLAVAAAFAAAFAVAGAIKRSPPDFSRLPIAATIRDAGGRPLWVIRLACDDHLAAAASVTPPPGPAVGSFELWAVLPPPSPPHALAPLPLAGRRVFAVIPQLCQTLADGALVVVSGERGGGAHNPAPSGPVLFRARIASGLRTR